MVDISRLNPSANSDNGGRDNLRTILENKRKKAAYYRAARTSPDSARGSTTNDDGDDATAIAEEPVEPVRQSPPATRSRRTQLVQPVFHPDKTKKVNSSVGNNSLSSGSGSSPEVIDVSDPDEVKVSSE